MLVLQPIPIKKKKQLNNNWYWLYLLILVNILKKKGRKTSATNCFESKLSLIWLCLCLFPTTPPPTPLPYYHRMRMALCSTSIWKLQRPTAVYSAKGTGRPVRPVLAWRSDFTDKYTLHAPLRILKTLNITRTHFVTNFPSYRWNGLVCLSWFSCWSL